MSPSGGAMATVEPPITWSPERRTRDGPPSAEVPASGSNRKQRWLGAWPGVCSAVRRAPGTATLSPSVSSPSGTNPSRAPKPRSVAPVLAASAAAPGSVVGVGVGHKHVADPAGAGLDHDVQMGGVVRAWVDHDGVGRHRPGRCWSRGRSSPTGSGRGGAAARGAPRPRGRARVRRSPVLGERARGRAATPAGSAGPAVDQLLALDLVQPTPDAVRLADAEGVVEAGAAHGARAADRLGRRSRSSRSSLRSTWAGGKKTSACGPRQAAFTCHSSSDRLATTTPSSCGPRRRARARAPETADAPRPLHADATAASDPLTRVDLPEPRPGGALAWAGRCRR